MMPIFREHILYGFWRVLFADKNFQKSKFGFNFLVLFIFLKHWDAILFLGIPREDKIWLKSCPSMERNITN